MKKILKILLILFLFLSCYLIYIITDKDIINYMAIGNNSDFNKYVIDDNTNYNDLYTNNDYRIVDLVNIIKYNQEKDVSIHYLLNKANILTINVGMNELYEKLDNNTHDIYSYLNEMVSDMNILLNEISRYDYDKVFVIGYYNIDRKNNDIFTYINYKIKRLVLEYGYKYIDLNRVIGKNDLIKTDSYELNNIGKEKISKKIVKYYLNN